MTNLETELYTIREKLFSADMESAEHAKLYWLHWGLQYAHDPASAMKPSEAFGTSPHDLTVAS